MIAIPVSGEVVRRALRTFVVAAITVSALAFALPGYLVLSPLISGATDFYTAANVVVYPKENQDGVSMWRVRCAADRR